MENISKNAVKTVCAVDMCCGCMACSEICSKGAIDIIDSLKSFNAVKNDKCVDCGLCEKICPQNNPVETKEPIEWYQGWAKDDIIRKNSSSGGYASSIAKSFIEAGGIVCSCEFYNGTFGFSFARNNEELRGFAGSKYVKSNPKEVYRKAKKKLQNGERLLYIALPCQIAGLKSFVGQKLQDNLYTIDLICHGTPSELLLNKFLMQYDIKLQEVDSISFRHKTSFALNGDFKQLTLKGSGDCYTLAFLHGLCYTNNCYECQYAKKKRVSDLTLGDSWLSELSSNEVQNGISLVLCQTVKGKELLTSGNLKTCPIDLNDAILHNGQLSHASIRPNNWYNFFCDLNCNKSFNRLVFKYLTKAYIRQVIKRICLRLGIVKLSGGIYQISIRQKK